MGRIAGFIIFLAFFVVFALIKFVFTGARAAYQAVFNPNNLDENAKLFLGRVWVKTDLELKTAYMEDGRSIQGIVSDLIPQIQSLGREFGYEIDRNLSKNLILRAIEDNSIYVSGQELDRANRAIV